MPRTVKKTRDNSEGTATDRWPVLPDWWTYITAWDPGDLDNWYHPDLLNWSAEDPLTTANNGSPPATVSREKPVTNF
jgi:hypothetical protein